MSSNHWYMIWLLYLARSTDTTAKEHCRWPQLHWVVKRSLCPCPYKHEANLWWISRVLREQSPVLLPPRALFPILNQRSFVLPTEWPLKWCQPLDLPAVITTDCKLTVTPWRPQPHTNNTFWLNDWSLARTWLLLPQSKWKRLQWCQPVIKTWLRHQHNLAQLSTVLTRRKGGPGVWGKELPIWKVGVSTQSLRDVP
jgi:hypothetical protein